MCSVNKIIKLKYMYNLYPKLTNDKLFILLFIFALNVWTESDHKNAQFYLTVEKFLLNESVV